jgi:hypothetical protein
MLEFVRASDLVLPKAESKRQPHQRPDASRERILAGFVEKLDAALMQGMPKDARKEIIELRRQCLTELIIRMSPRVEFYKLVLARAKRTGVPAHELITQYLGPPRR